MCKVFLVNMFVGFLFISGSALATTVHYEGFEDPHWVQGQAENWSAFFSTTKRVTSGTDGIHSSSGNAHAILKSSLIGAGPYTKFGGWSNNFGNGFATSLDIFLEPVWDAGRAFTYRVGVNNQSGDQLRFFDWRFKAQGSKLQIKAAHTEDSGKNGVSPKFFVSQAGWYTFENVFRNVDGNLLVDFNVYNNDKALLYSTSRGESSDSITSLVGGNRNGWLFNNSRRGVTGLAIDNTQLKLLVPEPTVIALMGFGFAGFALRRRK